MSVLKKLFLTTFLSVLLVGVGYIPSHISRFTAMAAEPDQTPKTLAILPFENNSITDPERYAPLSKGLSAMLITDLDKNGTSLKLIERDKIQSILTEIALSMGGGVDAATAVKAGKILGAQSIAFGSFMVMGKTMRIDTRIIEVETSEVLMAESITGNSKSFMDLEQELATKIAESLKIALNPSRSAPGSDVNAALYFSRGIDAMDKGDKAEAKRLFKKCVKLDPNFKELIDKVKGLG